MPSMTQGGDACAPPPCFELAVRSALSRAERTATYWTVIVPFMFIARWGVQ